MWLTNLLGKLFGITEDPHERPSAIKYCDYIIQTNPYRRPLNPDTAWMYTHEEYAGPFDKRIGYARTIDRCKDAIDELKNQ